jgi:FPC/CPF motif-containing protein YcgG
LEVPYAYVESRDTDEQKRIEQDVARVVSLLQDTAAKEMHFPKSASYFTEVDDKGNTTSLGIVYEPPTGVKSIKSLKGTLAAQQHVSRERKCPQLEAR